MVIARRSGQLGVKAQNMGDFSRGSKTRASRDEPKIPEPKPCGLSQEELKQFLEVYGDGKTMSVEDAFDKIRGQED